jgi:hypothetical protein
MPLPDQIGGLPKKQALMVGAGVTGLGLLVYWRYQQQKKQSQADAAAAAAAQAPGTGAGSSDQIDPATGFPYGSVEDAAALTTQAGYNSPIGGLGYSDTTYAYGGGSGFPGGVQPVGGFTSNAQWSQAVEDYLVNVAGGNMNTVGNAIGKYITGQPVDDTQEGVINQAIAFEGYPPVAGPDGYPPSIRKSPSGPSGPPSPAPQNVKVPNVTGKTWDEAALGLYAAHLNPRGSTNSRLAIVTKTSPAAGTAVKSGSDVIMYHR